MDQRKTSADEGGSLLPLWFGVLLPPIIWAVQMEIIYMLVRGACKGGRSWVLHLVVIAALMFVAICGVVAGSAWMVSGVSQGSDGSDLRSRNTFISSLGLLTSLVFFLVILAQGIGTLLFHPCQS